MIAKNLKLMQRINNNYLEIFRFIFKGSIKIMKCYKTHTPKLINSEEKYTHLIKSDWNALLLYRHTYTQLFHLSKNVYIVWTQL